MEELKKNRKQRRREASLARRAPKSRRDPNHWYKRVIKEMCQNEEIIENVVSGKFDKYLE